MNSFEVNTLPYIVNTLFTYRTLDRYRGFRIQLKEKEKEKKEKEKEKEKENKPKYFLFFQLIFQSIND